MLPVFLEEKGNSMRMCSYYTGSFTENGKECWIDYPDSSHLCPCEGKIEECPCVGLDGKPIKEKGNK